MAPQRNKGYSPAKVLYQLLQCLHHLSHLSSPNGKAVKAFDRKASELDRFIRPAVQNSEIQNEISDLNSAWATDVAHALAHHYRTQVSFLLGSIKAFGLSSNDLCTNMETAKNWARRHFGKKLKSETLAEFDKMVRAIFRPPIKKSDKQAKHRPLPSGQESQRGGVSPGGGARGVSSQASPQRQRLSTTPQSRPGRFHTPTQTPPPTPPQPSYSQAAKSPPIRPALPKKPSIPLRDNFKGLGYANGKCKVQGEALHKKWWIPKVARDILVLGTSNLSRITCVGRSDAQVVSFGGLKLGQLKQLLDRYKYGPLSKSPGLKPSKVIISAGLCDRDLAESTNFHNLKKVILAAKAQFPDSQIYLAQIPFSSNLPETEKKTLLAYNKAIQDLWSKYDNVHCINHISPGKFQVGSDNIHWTVKCANAMIKHYFDSLN